MIRGLIVSVVDGAHVYIPEIHPFGLNPTRYPVAPWMSPYQLENQTGVNQTLKSEQWCWIEFEKDDPHRPVIVGFVIESVDQTMSDFSVTKDGEGFQIRLSESGSELTCDGDVMLRIGSKAYISLYQQLNNLRVKLDEHERQLNGLNGHVHPVVAVGSPTGLGTTMYVPTQFGYQNNFIPRR